MLLLADDHYINTLPELQLDTSSLVERLPVSITDFFYNSIITIDPLTIIAHRPDNHTLRCMSSSFTQRQPQRRAINQGQFASQKEKQKSHNLSKVAQARGLELDLSSKPSYPRYVRATAHDELPKIANLASQLASGQSVPDHVYQIEGMVLGT